MKYVGMVSFGKDSVTMADLLCRYKIRLDELIFTDTLLELPQMYEYANKIKNYFETRYKVKFTILKPNTTFEEWCFGIMKKGKMKGYMRGIPNPADQDSQCYWRREAKVLTEERYNKDIEVIKYLGYTSEETRNVEGCLFPLRNKFEVDGVVHNPFSFNDYTEEIGTDRPKGMSELDCKKYLISREMENPLYKMFTRTGCGICPFQSERSWYQVWKNYPEEWEFIKFIEKRLQYYEDRGMKIANKHWFPDYKTTSQMEYKFSNSNNHLLDFNDEPVKDCLCKI